MTNAKRGRGSRRGIYLCAVAALGFALSGCGGDGGDSSAAASSAQSSTTGSTASSTSSTATASSGSGQSTSTSSGTSTSTAGSGSNGSDPPTASSADVTINWTPPTENTNGTPLTNLAGYDIRYGTSSGNYTQTITVSNPGIATYVVTNLAPGKYYFAVAAVNSAGTEGPLSSEVSATVN